ncbi:MAG: glycerate kinase [Christensenellales bacterium]
MPDSFKGTMSSAEICQCMRTQICAMFRMQKLFPSRSRRRRGKVEVFGSYGRPKVEAEVYGPLGTWMTAHYGIVSQHTAPSWRPAELAAGGGPPEPEKTTTFGVGQLMLDAVKRGCRKIIVGLGGSCTNDGGAGAASACGAKFYDAAGRVFTPVGGTLNHIARVDLSGLKAQMKGIEIVAMCDIDNPLCGPQGAAAVFGPQKGADGAMVARLDEGLCHLAEVVRRDTGCDAMDAPGAGAAGGMGYGMLACFGAKLQMGIETVLDTVSFETLAQRADIILTGEGRMDGQSLRGKVVMGIARRAKPLGVPVVAVVGDIGDDIAPAYEQGVTGIFSINRVAQDFEKVRARSKSDLALTMDNLVRFCVSMGL